LLTVTLIKNILLSIERKQKIFLHKYISSQVFPLSEQELIKIIDYLLDHLVMIHQCCLFHANLKLKKIFIHNNKLKLIDIIFCQLQDLSELISCVVDIFHL
jgi:hypothetical protein